MTDTETADLPVAGTTEATKVAQGPVLLKIDDGTATVQAANGRIITVKPLEAVGFYKLTKALGVSASNPVTMDMAMLAASLVKINNPDPGAGPNDLFMPFPKSDGEVEATIKMLGFEGLAAIGAGLQALGEQALAGAYAAKN